MIPKDYDLTDIAWNVDEPTYREDPAYSYSTIAKFDREGFSKLDTLFDKTSSPSLTFGSMVDTMLTDGEQAFNDRFFVANFPALTESLTLIAQQLYARYGDNYTSIGLIPDSDILDLLNAYGYQPRWRDTTRIDDVRKKCEEYYSQLLLSNGKEVVSNEDYQDCLNCISALRESEATKWYFEADNPWGDIKRYYQLKFTGTYKDINLRCMADLIIVDYANKTIQPCDLKTSSHFEYDFYQSFIQWRYYIQAQLYWYIIRQNMDKHPIFKDFQLLNYRFIVVNRKTLNPLVWEYPDTKAISDVIYGEDITCKNWRGIVTRLDYYLKNPGCNPVGIFTDKPNNIVSWLNLRQ